MSITVNFIQEMFMLYCISVLGFVVRKKGILNEHANGVLTQIILYITLPALILYSLDIKFSFAYISNFSWLIGLSAYILFVSCLIAFFMRKYTKISMAQKNVYEGLIIFGNQGFIGYAVSFILLKEQGVIYLTIFNILYLILIWTYGIYLFTKSKETIDWKGIFFNPGILSTVIGLTLFISPLSWPTMVGDTLNSVGQMTIPLSMLVIGSLVANINYKEMIRFMKNRSLWNATIVKLLIIPLCFIPFFMLPIPYEVFLIAFLVSGMPAASTIVLYAQRFGGDTLYGSVGVLLSTLLCIITIPFLYFLVNFMY